MWSTLSTLTNPLPMDPKLIHLKVIDHILGKKEEVNLISRSRMFTFYYF
jgi:hypothetical protein